MSGNTKNVLVIDDEGQVRRLLRVTLESAGHSVREADNGVSGLAEVSRQRPDAVILDLGLPDLGGMDVLHLLRQSSKVPVLVLTAVSDEGTKVTALDQGADDFLVKPFSQPELLARLRAICRRVSDEDPPAIYSYGEVTVNFDAHTVLRRNEEVTLTRREFAILRMLIANRGRVVTHGQLLREIWGPGHENNTHYLRVHMTHLRQKLEAVPHHPKYLRTESGIGYRLREN